MPLTRTYSTEHRRVISTLYNAYQDKLSRHSDIQEYLQYIHTCAVSYENVQVLELGTRKGNSTLAFLAAAEKTNGHVWSNDILKADKDPKGMAKWSPNKYWTFVHGDDMDPVVQEQFPTQVDVLFIDTSHEYEHTLHELHAYMPRLTPDGVALFHDTNLYLRDGFMTLNPGDGTETPPVRQALNAYCKAMGLSWEDVPGEYGLGVIHASETSAAS